MKAESISTHHEQLVQAYFAAIRELRAGHEDAVERLVDMWDPDGTFEFAGTPPVTGTFHGRNAIHTLYKNRLHANGMRMHLEGHDDEGGPKQSSARTDAELGLVDTKVHRTRAVDNKLVAGWTTVIGTKDGRGYEVSGSHTFTFYDGKISNLKVVISPRPHDEKTGSLSLRGLSVTDIGRLALAAWPVV
jgi:ketosteroid isomerase-like protein